LDNRTQAALYAVEWGILSSEQCWFAFKWSMMIRFLTRGTVGEPIQERTPSSRSRYHFSTIALLAPSSALC
jgi:hypothetical protein